MYWGFLVVIVSYFFFFIGQGIEDGVIKTESDSLNKLKSRGGEEGGRDEIVRWTAGRQVRSSSSGGGFSQSSASRSGSF